MSFSTGLVEVATRTGDTTGAANSHRWPSFLPDGRRFLYYTRGTESHRGIYVGSLDGAEPVRIVESEYNGQYANGFLLTVRQGTLVAYPFDERSATVTGDPIQVADRIGGSSTQHAAFSVSAAGVLVHAGDTSEISRLTWFDRNGREADPQLPAANITSFRLAPDGRQVALARMDPDSSTTDIWWPRCDGDSPSGPRPAADDAPASQAWHRPLSAARERTQCGSLVRRPLQLGSARG